MAPSPPKFRRSARNPNNEISRTIYCSVQQDARHRLVADESFGGNISKALVSRFEEVDELTILPAFLRPRLAAAARRAALSTRDYVIKVLSEHALSLPEPKPDPGRTGQ